MTINLTEHKSLWSVISTYHYSNCEILNTKLLKYVSRFREHVRLHEVFESLPHLRYISNQFPPILLPNQTLLLFAPNILSLQASINFTILVIFAVCSEQVLFIPYCLTHQVSFLLPRTLLSPADPSFEPAMLIEYSYSESN